MEVRSATALSQSQRFQAHTRLKASPKGSAFGQLLITGVAVEKLHFLQNSRNLGDRKCLGKPRKSFVGLPNAILFLRISREGVFQQPRDLSSIMTRVAPHQHICYASVYGAITRIY